jgi:soluble lytic murein transglycosylase-like protein
VPPRYQIAVFLMLLGLSWGLIDAAPRFFAHAGMDAAGAGHQGHPRARALAGVAPEAVAAFSEGRFEDVLVALPSEGVALEPEARYLRARALAELNRPGEALDALPNPIPTSWPTRVQADLASLKMRWSAEAGRCAPLENAAQSGASTETKLLLGRCSFVAGDYARARELLKEAKDPQARGMVVRSLVALKDDAQALPLARALFVDHPNHSEAKYCQGLLERASAASARAPSGTPRPSARVPEGTLRPVQLTLDEHLKRAEGLLSSRRPEAAHEELKNLDKSTPKAQRARLWHLRGEALFRTRKTYAEAEKAFAKAASFGGDSEAYDAFHAIRSASRAGQDAQAIRRYRAYAKRYPKSPLTPDALYLSAWLSAREKRVSARDALKQFVTSDAGKRAPGLRRDATWDLAWLALERGDAHDASHWLEESEKIAEKPLWAARISYWRGRAAQLERDLPQARKFFLLTLEQDRLGYYAQLAARRLIAMGDPPPPAFPATSTPAATSLPEAPAVTPPPEVAFYRTLGLSNEAAEAGKSWLDSQPDRFSRVAAWRAMGDVSQAYSAVEPLLGEVLAQAPDARNRWLWEALLPRPFSVSVNESSAQAGLPSALFYAHMQVESRYKPRAVSGADALGLMQLLPSTAAAVAAGLGIPSERSALLQPATNIALGARYLSGLVSRYQGQYPLAIAAYNAGTQRVDGMLTPGQPVELDRWVERISVEQTRNYVRRVLGAFSRYHALEAPAAPWDMPIPETVSLRTK